MGRTEHQGGLRRATAQRWLGAIGMVAGLVLAGGLGRPTVSWAERGPTPLVGGLPSALLAQPSALGAPDAASGAQDPVLAADAAALEVVQPEVQWAPSAADWQAVSAPQLVQVGDRVRTLAGGAARLAYGPGSATNLGGDTELLLRRLDRGGGLGVTTFMARGSSASVASGDGARLDLETPAATVFVQGAASLLQVSLTGTTRVGNPADGTGPVNVEGKDPARTMVTLQPGEQTDVRPGQPPLPAAPLGGPTLSDDAAPAGPRQARAVAVAAVGA